MKLATKYYISFKICLERNSCFRISIEKYRQQTVRYYPLITQSTNYQIT